MKNMRKTGLYLAVILGCVAVFLFPKLNALYAFFLIAGLIIAFLKKYADLKDARFLTIMIMLIVVTRLFLALLVMEARGEKLTQDEGLYSKKAILKVYEMRGFRNLEGRLAEFYDNDTDLLNAGYGYNVYTYSLAGFYYIFGHQIQAVRLINVFLCIAVFLLVFYTGKELFGYRAAALSSAIFAFFPSITLWSASVGVDMTVLLCISAYLFSLIKSLKKFRMRWVFIMAASFCALWPIRAYAASSLILVTFFGIVWVLLGKMTKKGRVLSGLLTVLAVIAFVNTPLMNMIEKNVQENIRVAIWRQGGFAVVDDGGYLIFPDHCYLDNRCDFKELAGAYAKGMFYVLFSPFPWKIGSKLQLLAYPQIVLWYCILPFVIYGFYAGYKKNKLYTFIMLLYCFWLFSVFALAEGNMGGLFRHRDMAVPFVLIFFAVGVCDLYDRYFKNQPRKV